MTEKWSYRNVFDFLRSYPRSVFVVDGIGALVSAVSLGFVIPLFINVFGIPRDVLVTLTLFPIVFFIYDLIIFFFATNKQVKGALKCIAIFNISYCLLSIVMMFSHLEQITVWGWLYLVVEIMLVLLFAKFEWKVSHLT